MLTFQQHMRKYEGSIYMTVKNIMEKLKTVLSLALPLWADVQYYFMLSWKTVQYFIAYQLARLFNVVFKIEEVPRRRLDELELWNSFSYYPCVNSWNLLSAASGKYIGKDKKWHYGKYLFTVDWAHPDGNILDTDHSEIPHEHKCAHIIALDDGNYAAQPNNRCIWDLPSFTVKDSIPDWKVQTNEWNVEDTGAWKTEDTDNFFYEIEEKK